MRFRINLAVLATSLMVTTLAMATAFAAQEKQVSEPGKPKLVIVRAEHDFGEVKSGTALKHTFTIKNEGTSDLLVQNVAPA